MLGQAMAITDEIMDDSQLLGARAKSTHVVVGLWLKRANITRIRGSLRLRFRSTFFLSLIENQRERLLHGVAAVIPDYCFLSRHCSGTKPGYDLVIFVGKSFKLLIRRLTGKILEERCRGESSS